MKITSYQIPNQATSIFHSQMNNFSSKGSVRYLLSFPSKVLNTFPTVNPFRSKEFFSNSCKYFCPKTENTTRRKSFSERRLCLKTYPASGSRKSMVRQKIWKVRLSLTKLRVNLSYLSCKKFGEDKINQDSKVGNSNRNPLRENARKKLF